MPGIEIHRFSRRRASSKVHFSTAHCGLHQGRRRAIMQVPSVVHHNFARRSQDLSTLTQIEIVPTRAPAAANDDQIAVSAGDRPNPLWAINAALAAFLLVAAMVIASG
jgi:hypothetical protein